jgi:hypothetical protein
MRAIAEKIMSINFNIVSVALPATRLDAVEARAQRFFGRPEFLLESNSQECYPFGLPQLTLQERKLIAPDHGLPCLQDDTTLSLADLAVELVQKNADRFATDAPAAVLIAHSCMSEDVSTCVSNRIIDLLGISGTYSFTVLSGIATAWANALQCVEAIQANDDAAPDILLVVGEKWMSPYPHAYSPLFAMSDGMALVRLTCTAPYNLPHVRIHSVATWSAPAAPWWLTSVAAVDLPCWLSTVEEGLQYLSVDADCTGQEEVEIVCGPCLGVSRQQLLLHSPRLAGLVERTFVDEQLPGHFGSAEPFIRLHGVLQRHDGLSIKKRILFWSVGPDGSIALLHGDIETAKSEVSA